MGVFKNLLPGSYASPSTGNVSFLVPTESVERGSKTVTHEYPNTDKRFIENLGRFNPVFTLDLIIHGEDAKSKRLLLEKALDTPGIGVLKHPIYGDLDVSVVGQYTVSSADRAVGEFRFRVTFAETEENVTPALDTVDESSVKSAAGIATDSVIAAVDKDYKAPSFVDGVIKMASDFVDKVTEVASAGRKLVGSAQRKIEAFNRTVSDLKEFPFKVVEGVSSFSNSVRSLYSTFDSMASVPSDLLDAAGSVFDAATATLDLKRTRTEAVRSLLDVGPIPLKKSKTTFQRIETEANREVLEQASKLMSLSMAYDAAAAYGFPTVTDLQEYSTFLEESYLETLMGSSSDTGAPIGIAADPNVRIAFAELRRVAVKVFAEKEKNTWRIVEVNRGRTSLSLVAFMQYNNLDNIELLQDLNSSLNHSSINENIKLVTE